MTLSNPSPTRINAAIYYHPDGYITTRDKLMGRHAAGEGFLRGFARYAQAEKLYAYAESQQHFEQFSEQVRPFANGKVTAWLPKAQPERLVEAGTLYLPSPDLADFSWQRRFHNAYAYSITGITHTICTDRVMDSLGSLLIAPVEEWDAIIFTSKEVKTAAENIMSSYGEYLGQRFGSKPVLPRLQMPVIPLGVDCAHLAGKGDNEDIRNRLRQQFEIGEQDIVVLYFGRLSYHAKAHPLPMYLALEAASKKTAGKIHLIQAGWFANDSLKNAFIEAAGRVCPSVNSLFVDGRTQEIRDNIWRAADIFCSLSDNIQETFGLTPIEAMAAGLPVVVSDWDGYRDTMEPGATGFTIPSTIPAAGCGKDLMYRYYTGTDTYDQYIGNVSQTISVDVEATTRAFIELIENPDLRRRMGQRGQQRAREKFDWQVVIADYEALWQDLGERRTAASKRANKQTKDCSVPLRADPFSIYAHYATQVLELDSKIQLIGDNPFKILPLLASLSMNKFSTATLVPAKDMKDLLRKIRKSDGLRLGDLLAEAAPEKQLLLQRSIGWLAKLGLVKCNS